MSTTQAQHSPARQHEQRRPSSQREIRETSNATSEYSNSPDASGAMGQEHRVNQYIIKEEIGRGSYGAVHYGVDHLGGEFAIKEFSKSRLRRRVMSEMLRRGAGRRGAHGSVARSPESGRWTSEDESNSFSLIKEEIAVMKKLDHGNLVSLIEVLDVPHEDSLFMVLEMCKKGVIMKMELNEPADPYPIESCRCWFRDLILGIEYLHAHNIIHRDIKPDNCLLTEDDTLKIVDFGVSEIFEKDSDMIVSKTAGSPAFMAPELCRKMSGTVYGKPADIWSMGITLYCLVFGRIPFQHGAALELYRSITEDEIDMSGIEDPNLLDLMQRILEKDPSKRITMRELRNHPWVTMEGEDPLLSEEQNCMDLVGPPTEEEKDAAITRSLSHAVTVMKAVNRFKTLLDHRKPTMFSSFLNQASRIVQPPMQIPVGESLAYRMTGSHHNSDGIAGRISKAADEVRSIIRAKTFSEDVARESEEEDQAHSDLRERTLSLDAGKGHAHDILRDHLPFLKIGNGAEDSTDATFVSESPPPAGFDIYQKAFEEETDRIKRSMGFIYLTRHSDNSLRSTEKNENKEWMSKSSIADAVRQALNTRPEKSTEEERGAHE